MDVRKTLLEELYKTIECRFVRLVSHF